MFLSSTHSNIDPTGAARLIEAPLQIYNSYHTCNKRTQLSLGSACVRWCPQLDANLKQDRHHDHPSTSIPGRDCLLALVRLNCVTHHSNDYVNRRQPRNPFRREDRYATQCKTVYKLQCFSVHSFRNQIVPDDDTTSVETRRTSDT